MNNQEYEQKKRECWEEFKRQNLDGEVQWQPVSRYDVFCAAFDRAYALGKQEKDAEGEEVLTVSRKKVQELYAEAQKAVPTCEHDRGYRNAELIILRNLFGSKCLPDETKYDTKEPKPAEQTDKNPKENANTFALTQGDEPVRLENDHLQVRLQVAAKAAKILQSIFSNHKMLKNQAHGETTLMGEIGSIVDAIAMYTDALIDKIEQRKTEESHEAKRVF